MLMTKTRAAYRLLAPLTFLALAGLLAMAGNFVIGQSTILEPGDQFSADVTTTYEQDPFSKLYTYTFDISSKSISKQDIWSIIVETTGQIVDTKMPQGWFFDVFADRPLGGWSIGRDEPIQRFILKPGQGKRFALISPDPPGPGWIYLEGLTGVPTATDEILDLLETNPALFDPTVNSVRVAATVPQAFSSLRITSSPTTIDLSKPKDTIKVVAFGSQNLPALRDVNVHTWGFGPASAAETHGTVHLSDVDGDGVEDVELHFFVGGLGLRRGDNIVCLFGRIDGPDTQWLRGCASAFVP